MFPVTFTDILRSTFGIEDPTKLDETKSEQVKFLQRLLLTSANHDHKALLLESDSMVRKMIDLANASTSYNIDDLKKALGEMLDGNQDEVYISVLTAFTIFLKENQVGQSVYTEYVEETKCPIDQSGPLPDLEFDPISWKN